MGGGEVNNGALGDSSGRWVSIKCGPLTFNFSFDMTGEEMDRIAVYRDIYAKVDEEKIFEIEGI